MHMVPQQTPCSLLISDVTLLPEPIWEATPETQLVAQGPPPPRPVPPQLSQGPIYPQRQDTFLGSSMGSTDPWLLSRLSHYFSHPLILLTGYLRKRPNSS